MLFDTPGKGMNIADIQKDVRYWQRLLRLAGYYTGKTDGIVGPLTRAAEARWIEAAAAAREKYGTFDERSEANISTLLPKAQEIARRWLKAARVRAAELGVEVRIIDGNRSYAEQDRLYAKRPKVTNARGGQSWHNFGLAFDFGVFRGASYLGDSPHYKTLGSIATSIPGTTWGGTWAKLVDEPHIQLNLFPSISAARAAFEK